MESTENSKLDEAIKANNSEEGKGQLKNKLFTDNNKKNLICVSISVLVTAVICMGVFSLLSGGGSKAMVDFRITGDVSKEVAVESFDEWEKSKIKVDEESYSAISFMELIEEAKPIGEDIMIIISAPDGVRAEITYDEITEEAMIYFSEEYGWTFESPIHPVQSGIKGINNVVVVAETPSEDTPGVNIINDKEDTFISCGELFKKDKIQKMILEGEPVMEGIMTNAYSTRDLVPISNYSGSSSNIIGYFKDGSQEEISGDGYILWRGNTIDYIGEDGKSITEDIIGIWVNAPNVGITDIRGEVEATNGKVLVIEIDGLGMNAFEKYKPSYIYSKSFEPMRTVMPSISNVALASIVSGETPDVTGVTSKKERILETDDMFEGKDSVLIEGYSQLITTSIDQTLNPDRNKDGSTDDDVFESAMKALGENHELTYVHFHGFDDQSHNFGPFSKEAENKLTELDGYVKALSESFEGKVFIVSDHGQHETENQERIGNHGNFYYSDMAVPFIQYEV